MCVGDFAKVPYWRLHGVQGNNKCLILLAPRQRLEASNLAEHAVKIDLLAIAHQERAAGLEPSVDICDRNALPVGSRDNSVASLKDETASFRHPPILRHRRELWHAYCRPRSNRFSGRESTGYSLEG